MIKISIKCKELCLNGKSNFDFFFLYTRYTVGRNDREATKEQSVALLTVADKPV